MSPEVVETLRKYASFPLEEYAVPLFTYRLLNESGRDFMTSHSNNWATSWGRIFLALRHAFEESSSGGLRGVYRTDCKVVDVVESGSGVTVEYETTRSQRERCSADLVLGADGASSTLRHLVEPETKRSYVGYVILRGMVPSSELSEETKATFYQTGAAVFPRDTPQVVAYTVPNTEPQEGEAETCLNWAWYQRKTEAELEDLMTDGQGTRYTYTLPMGRMRQEVAQAIKNQAAAGLPPQIAEAVQKTAQPFVQIVTDNIAGENCFLGGKMLLVGDAAAGQR
jgi:2-polyprenyl-6-methoxyphenol hydroxylase-like FAD-dependent oxidoreductase